jgi:hypothetical protein
MTRRAESVRVFVHRDKDGALLAVASSTSALRVAPSENVTEQDVWIEVQP